MMNILLIDNRDSFTFNLAESCRRLGAGVDVVRNDIGADAALKRARAKQAILLLSPGPGQPSDAGCCLDLIALAKGEVPLIGICLGHQAIILEAGGPVERSNEVMHGRSSLVPHDGTGPFQGLPSPIRIGRYHSLVTPRPPANFDVHISLDGAAMAISDASSAQVGLQFHPESILTPLGDELLKSCLDWLEAGRG
jgi:anthranilate synthase/aminodeoxychorismate synthase-like glutamine amidotransferase